MPERRLGRGQQQLAAALLPLLGLLGFVALWWLSLTLFAPPTSFLARFAPDRTASSLISLVGGGQLWPHLIASLRRVLIGLAISASLGIPLGLAVGSSRLLARLSGPLFQFIRMVSPLAWTPLAIILLGVGDGAVLFLLVIGGIWPIVLNTSAASAALDRRWLTLGRSLAASRLELARTIVWPGVRPNVLTGLRLAVGLAWIILVPAEMLGVDSGLGYFLLDTRDRLAYSDLMATIIIIGACGFVIDSTARWLLRERRGQRRGAGRRGPAALAAETEEEPAGPGQALTAGPREPG